MRILIFGGTGFMGWLLTKLALVLGRDASLFNRGKSGRDLFPEAEWFVGERSGEPASLKRGRGELCFDIASYFPRVTRFSCAVLADKVRRYSLVSTMAFYGLPSETLLHLLSGESAPVYSFKEGI